MKTLTKIHMKIDLPDLVQIQDMLKKGNMEFREKMALGCVIQPLPASSRNLGTILSRISANGEERNFYHLALHKWSSDEMSLKYPVVVSCSFRTRRDLPSFHAWLSSFVQFASSGRKTRIRFQQSSYNATVLTIEVSE